MASSNETSLMHVADYVIFGSVIIISGLIGFYFIFKNRKQKTTDSYMLGNRKFKVILTD